MQMKCPNHKMMIKCASETTRIKQEGIKNKNYELPQNIRYQVNYYVFRGRVGKTLSLKVPKGVRTF